MKKIITIIITFLIFLFIYFLQINLFTWFNLGGIKPNPIVILILILGLFGGEKLAIFSGLIFGLLLDMYVSRIIGPMAIAYTIIGILGIYLNKNFSKESRLSLIVMAIVSTIVFETILCSINVLGSQINFNLFEFLKITIIESLFNGILVIIFYPIIFKFGNILEDVFDAKKKITRYF